MAGELAILLDARQRRRQHFDAVLLELGAALVVHMPEPEPPKPRVVSAPGYRETGLARFRNVRVASASRDI